MYYLVFLSSYSYMSLILLVNNFSNALIDSTVVRNRPIILQLNWFYVLEESPQMRWHLPPSIGCLGQRKTSQPLPPHFQHYPRLWEKGVVPIWAWCSGALLLFNKNRTALILKTHFSLDLTTRKWSTCSEYVWKIFLPFSGLISQGNIFWFLT